MTDDMLERVRLHLNNALRLLNLKRRDIAALQDGEIISISINQQRAIGREIEAAQDAIDAMQPTLTAEIDNATGTAYIDLAGRECEIYHSLEEPEGFVRCFNAAGELIGVTVLNAVPAVVTVTSQTEEPTDDN